MESAAFIVASSYLLGPTAALPFLIRVANARLTILELDGRLK
jgi:hypothetical protein